jgi:hypothetical protein
MVLLRHLRIRHRIEIGLDRLNVLLKSGKLEHELDPKLRAELKASKRKGDVFSRRRKLILKSWGYCDNCLRQSTRRVRVASRAPYIQWFKVCVLCVPYVSTFARVLTVPIETSRSRH